MSIPADKRVTPLDNHYLQYFFETRRKGTVLGLCAGHDIDNTCRFIPKRFNLVVWEEPMRYAAMADASYRMATSRRSRYQCPPSEHTLQYLGQCHKYLQDAISTSVSFDLIYACHTLIKLACRMEEPIQTIQIHLFGLCQIIKSLVTTTDERNWEDAQAFWLNSLWSVYGQLRRLLPQCRPVFTIQVKKAVSVIEDFPHIISTGLRRSWRIIQLRTYIDYYFAYYLTVINQVADRREVGTDEKTTVANTLIYHVDELIELILQDSGYQLRDVVHKIDQIRLEHHIEPITEDTPTLLGLDEYDLFDAAVYLSLLHFRTLLLTGESHHDRHSAAELSAISLFQVSALRVAFSTDSWWNPIEDDLRDLCFMALVLTKCHFPAGDIRNLLC